MKYFKKACWLCKSSDGLVSIRGADERSYYFCKKCYLISVDKKYLPDKQTEKGRYLAHQNGIQFDGYVRFLLQAVTPALNFIKKDTPVRLNQMSRR